METFVGVLVGATAFIVGFQSFVLRSTLDRHREATKDLNEQFADIERWMRSASTDDLVDSADRARIAESALIHLQAMPRPHGNLGRVSFSLLIAFFMLATAITVVLVEGATDWWIVGALLTVQFAFAAMAVVDDIHVRSLLAYYDGPLRDRLRHVADRVRSLLLIPFSNLDLLPASKYDVSGRFEFALSWMLLLSTVAEVFAGSRLSESQAEWLQRFRSDLDRAWEKARKLMEEGDALDEAEYQREQAMLDEDEAYRAEEATRLGITVEELDEIDSQLYDGVYDGIQAEESGDDSDSGSG